MPASYRIQIFPSFENTYWDDEFQFKDVGKAIERARHLNKLTVSGDFIHRVVEEETGKVVYERGWIKDK